MVAYGPSAIQSLGATIDFIPASLICNSVEQVRAVGGKPSGRIRLGMARQSFARGCPAVHVLRP
jgi:hypothetical protein